MDKRDSQTAGGSQRVTARLKTPGRRWRFAIVLAASIAVSAGQPLLSDLLGDRETFDFGITLLISAVLLLEEPRCRRTAVPLGIAAFIALWASPAVDGAASSALLVASHLLTTCLFAYALIDIVRTILLGRATESAILGAVCGYLLLGIIWALLYSAVESTAPGSFHVHARGSAGEPAAGADRSALGYYSFITLATVGYGDITPVTPVARTLAWMEAVVGQFYLAVLVAGLVGYKVSRGPSRSLD